MQFLCELTVSKSQIYENLLNTISILSLQTIKQNRKNHNRCALNIANFGLTHLAVPFETIFM